MDYTLVNSEDQLSALIEKISNIDLLGIDTEFVAEDCYRPDLCLLQISTRDEVFIVDPKALEDVAELWQTIVDDRKTVVVHAGREESLFAYRATGRPIPKLFDVQLALGFLGGEYPASYGKLLQRVLSENVLKGETRTDWRKRPLSKAQLEYAGLDVLHLPALYDTLTVQLERVGRLDWLYDEVDRRQANLIETQEQEGWYRMSGIQALHGKQLSIVRELWHWRDQRAQSKNMPARRVLRDDLIIELAKRGSADAKAIAHIRGLHHPGFARFIPEIADCVSRGSKGRTPPIPWSRQNKRPRPPALLQQFLTAAMSYLCRTHSISPAIVGTSDDVGKLASYWMEKRDLEPTDEEYPHLLRGWRAGLVGEPLYDIFTGRKALRVQDPSDDMPLSLCELKS